MTRNPHAASLRAHKPKRIEDKRSELRIMAECAMTEWMIHEVLHSLDERDD